MSSELAEMLSYNGLQSASPFIDGERALNEMDYERAHACCCRADMHSMSRVIHGHVSDQRTIRLRFQRMFVSNPSNALNFASYHKTHRKRLDQDETHPLSNDVQVMYGASLYDIMQLIKKMGNSYTMTLRSVQCEMARMRGLCNQHPALATNRRMILAHLRFHVNAQHAEHAIDHSPSSVYNTLQPSEPLRSSSQSTGSVAPMRYRDSSCSKRQKRRNTIFERLRLDPRLREQDDNLAEQALTPLEAVILMYSLIDEMIRDKIFVPYEKITPVLVADDLRILLNRLTEWKRYSQGDGFLATTGKNMRDKPIEVELCRIQLAIDALERESGDMRTALNIATAAAWKYSGSSQKDNENGQTVTDVNSSTYVELARIKPGLEAHSFASSPPFHCLVSCNQYVNAQIPGKHHSDAWPRLYTFSTSNPSSTSYATSLSSAASSVSSLSGLSRVSGSSNMSTDSLPSLVSLNQKMRVNPYNNVPTAVQLVPSYPSYPSYAPYPAYSMYYSTHSSPSGV